ncbi:MAG: DUF6044 family protein [Bacteroidales bacterium]|jgi:hypothetical protein|nr:DUF6044 family protein [Bacteroidales bacterium]
MSRSTIYWIFTVCIFIIYFFPYFVLGEDAYFFIHDNLDSDVVWYKIVAENEHVFCISNENTIKQIMNGIPRNSLPSGYSLLTLLFIVCSPFCAFLINYMLTHIISFIGMFLLLKKHVFSNIFYHKHTRFFVYILSFSFALLPFYGTHPGIAISGIPLIVWAFVYLYNDRASRYHYLIIIFYAFYSSLIYVGVFILFFLGIIWLRKIYKTRRFSKQLFLGILFLFIGQLVSEIHLVAQFFDASFVSHRVEFFPKNLSFIESLQSAGKLLLFGYYHAPSYHGIILLFVVFTVLFFRKKCVHFSMCRLLQRICIVIVSIVLLYGIWDYGHFQVIKDNVALLKIIQWQRFYWLLPFLWIMAFSISIYVFLSKNKKIVPLYVVVILQFFVVLASNTKVLASYYEMVYPYVKNALTSSPHPPKLSYSRFYDTKLFAEIRDSIAEPPDSYRIVSIGLVPEIAVYNGFYTLDSYQRNYSLAYKDEFKKIISQELDKDSVINDYFNSWGSRCYIFSHELGIQYRFSKTDTTVISDLSLDYTQLKNMGAQYIFSAVPVYNEQQNLELFGMFQHNDSYWKIYVYEII